MLLDLLVARELQVHQELLEAEVYVAGTKYITKEEAVQIMEEEMEESLLQSRMGSEVAELKAKEQERGNKENID